MPTLEARTRAEVEDLHVAIMEWINGTLDDTDEVFEERLAARLDPDFNLVGPGGGMDDRATLLDGMRRGHGSNPAFRIQIRDVRLRADCGNHAVATYTERHRNARRSTPPDNARVSTVLFVVGARLTWLHLHETWAPKEVIAAGPYDF